MVFIPLLGSAAEEWRTFTSSDGRKMEARIVSVKADSVVVDLKSNLSQIMIDFKKLSKEDVEFLKQHGAGAAQGADTVADGTLPDGEPAVGKRYPRSKEQIRDGICEIEKRPKPDEVSKEVHKATQLLNIYRFLSGVPSEVQANAAFSKSATDAALACKQNGGLAHSLGHSTDKCNLSSMADVTASVSQYMEDAGANNREARGHRAWCLNPPMGKVGFGSGGDAYSAMWCMDNSGKPIRSSWAYPGKGLYPLEYLHGNAWSLYGAGQPGAPDKLKVEVFKLPKRPDKAFSAKGEIPGRVVKVNHVSIGMNAVNFEPEDANKQGVYWVRVNGGDIREGYLVELY